MLLECRPVIKDCSRCHFKPLVHSPIHQQTQSLAVKMASKKPETSDRQTIISSSSSLLGFTVNYGYLYINIS